MRLNISATGLKALRFVHQIKCAQTCCVFLGKDISLTVGSKLYGNTVPTADAKSNVFTTDVRNAYLSDEEGTANGGVTNREARTKVETSLQQTPIAYQLRLSVTLPCTPVRTKDRVISKISDQGRNVLLCINLDNAENLFPPDIVDALDFLYHRKHEVQSESKDEGDGGSADMKTVAAPGNRWQCPSCDQDYSRKSRRSIKNHLSTFHPELPS